MDEKMETVDIQEELGDIMNKQFISIIIPTYNSETTLNECLESIKAQTYQNIETIIIDNYSQDSTEKIAKEHGAIFFHFNGFPSAARNYGVMHAKGDYILFLDADQVLTPRVIEDCVNKCLSEKFDALAISEESIAHSFWAECVASSRDIFRDGSIILPRFFVKDALKKVKFDEELLFGEDFVLYLNLKKYNYKLSRVTFQIRHYENINLKSMIQKYYRYGKVSPLLLKKYGVMNFRPYLLYSLTTFVNRWIISKRFLHDPTHFFGLLFIKIIRFISMLLGIYF